MSEAASLELCEELFKLSGWDEKGMAFYQTAPAYNLGFLLRKLPKSIGGKALEVNARTKNRTQQEGWQVIYSSITNEGNRMWASSDTPEDAAAKLAIKLFKSGVLKR